MSKQNGTYAATLYLFSLRRVRPAACRRVVVFSNSLNPLPRVDAVVVFLNGLNRYLKHEISKKNVPRDFLPFSLPPAAPSTRQPS